MLRLVICDLPEYKRLEAGCHTLEDVIWSKHEFVEQYQEKKFNLGYKEAHKVYNGFPCQRVE